MREYQQRPEVKKRQKKSYKKWANSPKGKEALHKKQVREHNEWRDWIRSMKDAPCFMCNQTFHPAAMDFHHRENEEKLFSISDTRSKRARDKIITEIAKCDLICANCHRTLHADMRL